MLSSHKHFTLRTPTGALTTFTVGFVTDEPTSRRIAEEILTVVEKFSRQVAKDNGSLIEHVYTTHAGNFQQEGDLQ